MFKNSVKKGNPSNSTTDPIQKLVECLCNNGVKQNEVLTAVQELESSLCKMLTEQVARDRAQATRKKLDDTLKASENQSKYTPY